MWPLSKAQYDSLKQSKTAAIRKGRLVADTIDVRLRQADIGDLQLEGFVTLTQMNEICGINPRSSSHNFEPFSECPGARLMESSAGDQMALQIEMVVYGIVCGQKSLHCSG